jgi:hypothetical protein
MDLGLDVISIKQMSATHQSPAEVIFELTILCHIAIRIEANKAQTGLMECHICQKFGYVWANCKQPSRSMWCGGGHKHWEFPERGNVALIPTCCNCKLVGRNEPQPSNYWGCSYAEDEIVKWKLQREPKTTTGSAVSSNHTTPRLFCSGTAQQHTATAAASAAHSCTGLPCHSGRKRNEAQPSTCQSVYTPIINSSSLNVLFKIVIMVFQQIMT